MLKLCNRCWPMASSRPQWATSQQPRTSSASRWQPQYLQPHRRRTEVVRDWSSYYAASGASHWQSVRLVDGPGDGGKERLMLSFRPHFRQADVWLKRGDTYMSDMCNRCRELPLAVGSVPIYLRSKVNAQFLPGVQHLSQPLAASAAGFG